MSGVVVVTSGHTNMMARGHVTCVCTSMDQSSGCAYVICLEDWIGRPGTSHSLDDLLGNCPLYEHLFNTFFLMCV